MGSDFRSKSNPSNSAGTTYFKKSSIPILSDVSTSKKPQMLNSKTKTLNSISSNFGQKYFVKTKIQNRLVSLLVDTGSQVNVLPKKCLNVTALQKMKPSNLDLKSYSGNRIEVLGSLQMDIQIGKIFLKNVNFYIVENNLKPILGTPALQNNDIALCFSQNKMIQNGIKHADLIFEENSNIKDYNLNLVTTEKNSTTQILQLEATETTKIAAL